MKTILTLSLSVFGLASMSAQVPQMTAVDPGGGKIGSVLRVNGVNLDKDRVDEVYLSDRTLDMKVKVLEQSDKSIKFRIPPSVKPGRLQLVVKLTGKNALILEQPVFITVEEADQPTEIAASR